MEQIVRQIETEVKNLNQAVSRTENIMNQRSNAITMKQTQLEKYKKTIFEVKLLIYFYNISSFLVTYTF